VLIATLALTVNVKGSAAMLCGAPSVVLWVPLFNTVWCTTVVLWVPLLNTQLANKDYKDYKGKAFSQEVCLQACS